MKYNMMKSMCGDEKQLLINYGCVALSGLNDVLH